MGRATTLVLIGIIIILVLVLTLQLSSIKRAEREVAEAKTLAQATSALLDSTGVRCFARPTDILGLTECITPVLARNDFETVDFQVFDAEDNVTGVFIIKNVGQRTYKGQMFSLLKNGKEITAGCHIDGDILPEYTCRFTLVSACQRGDVLEITYGLPDARVRLVTNTC